MNFEIARSVLLNSIQSVASAASSKSSLPILSHILIQLTPEQLRLTATNLEIELSSITDCETNSIQVIEPGSLTVPAKKFLDVVRSFPEAVIKLSVKDGKLVLKCGRSRFTLSILDANDYPMYPEMGNVNSFCVVEKEFNNALRSVIHSVASKDVRYYLNGIHLDFNSAYGLNVVATDGHRLAVENIKLELENQDAFQMILTIDMVDNLLKLLKDGDEPIDLNYTSHSMAVSKNGVTLKAKLIDGKFPDYQRVIPKQSGQIAMIHRESFVNAIKRAQCVMDAKHDGLAFEFSKESLMISGKNADHEQSEEVIEIISSGIESEFLIGFNGRYMVDALNSMDTETIKILLIPSSLALIEPTEGCGQRVIMCMRL